ncbi:pathogenesis-related protein 1 [Jatropha curcas]|uniref:pathogenesis-related protein 1 n=1 Tax=Jatropha curcas TaxID=180498 RepID=UPI0018938D57|nr:pathogenesis-related protein 1 [Jatropha curcas]
MGFNKLVVKALIFMALTMVPLSLAHHSAHHSAAHDSPKDYLAAHNCARAELGIALLCWNTTLVKYAKHYTKSLVASCSLEHSVGCPYGENLAQGFGKFSGVDGVKLWVDEKAHYDYQSNTCVGGKCRHYTQVIWKNTKEVGCASVRCGEGWKIISCNYYPPGNYVGEKPY